MLILPELINNLSNKMLIKNTNRSVLTGGEPPFASVIATGHIHILFTLSLNSKDKK